MLVGLLLSSPQAMALSKLHSISRHQMAAPWEHSSRGLLPQSSAHRNVTRHAHINICLRAHPSGAWLENCACDIGSTAPHYQRRHLLIFMKQEAEALTHLGCIQL